ncbi:hypothetical protein B0H17DRAFT_698557 [Mycena rosella]|uniref:Fungal-type protein kinase domain-containing protein n=1 Tax=Mycena rosella TaxID=1033263 RepID=A0AAD7GTG9_MYCRO|nr:hypothetical protein B0H17DRAFT_698557 [Mycena rosella]
MDHAVLLDNLTQNSSPSSAHRTGTLPFMAADVLVNSNSNWAAHEPKRDLESFLYVFLWISWHYAGPGSAARQNFDIREIPDLAPWVQGDFVTIGRVKRDIVRDDWHRRVLPHCAPYFEPLKPCLTAWRQLYLDDELTHEAVLAVLRDALPGLEMEIWTRHDDTPWYGFGRSASGKAASLSSKKAKRKTTTTTHP